MDIETWESYNFCLLSSRQQNLVNRRKLGKCLKMILERRKEKWLCHLNISHELQNAIKVQDNKTCIVFESLNKGTQLNAIYFLKQVMWKK